MTVHRLRAILIGPSNPRVGQSLTVALGLFIGSYVLLTYTGGLGDALTAWIGTGYNLLFIMLFFLGVAAAHSYVYNGLVLSVILVTAPLLGFFYSGNMAFPREPTLVEYVLIGLESGFLYGIPLGVLGYLIGRGLARFQGPPPDSSTPESR